MSLVRRRTARPSPDGMRSLEGDRTGIGSVAGDIWSAVKGEAKKTGAAAVKGVGQSIGDRLRNAVGVPSFTTAGRTRQAVMGYMPWIAGAGGALLLGWMVMRRHT